jgi:hypothetical protein
MEVFFGFWVERVDCSVRCRKEENKLGELFFRESEGNINAKVQFFYLFFYMISIFGFV